MIKFYLKKIANIIIGNRVYILPAFTGFNKGKFSILRKNSISQFVGTYEQELLPHLINLITKNKYQIIYDVGASYGYYTSYFAQNSEAKIVSFEPDIKPFNILKKLKQKIGSNLLLINKFISLEKNENEISLENAFIKYGIPDLIKIDIEGEEKKLLLENLDLLRKKNITIIVEVHSQEIENLIIKGFEKADFICKIVDSDSETLKIRKVNFNRWLIIEGKDSKN